MRTTTRPLPSAPVASSGAVPRPSGSAASTLKARWHEEAEGFGHTADAWLAGVLGHERVVDGAPGAKALATVVSRLEERSATWGRSDVVEECSRLVTGPDAGGVHRLVEALADEVLRDPEVVSLAAPLPAEAPSSLRRRDQMVQFERHGAVRFATTGTLRREAFVLEAAAEGVAAGIAVVPGGIVEAVLTATCSPAAPWDTTRPRRCGPPTSPTIALPRAVAPPWSRRRCLPGERPARKERTYSS